MIVERMVKSGFNVLRNGEKITVMISLLNSVSSRYHAGRSLASPIALLYRDPIRLPLQI